MKISELFSTYGFRKERAIEALEKQIAKEPEWEGGLSFYEDDAEAFCPACSYYFRDDLLYCPECGQKILWR